MVWAAVLLVFRHDIRRCWSEPVLRCPVVIIESDDWGPGPEEHAKALEALAALLKQYRDQAGRSPVMTLGVILAVPDARRTRNGDPGLDYHRVELDDPRCTRVLDAMRNGVRDGVFTTQLHGLEHYWPPALMKAAAISGSIREWLGAHEFPATEQLPSALQSRWIDGAESPAAPLADSAVTSALAEEVRVFTRIFSRPPAVYVPTTFIWTEAVERAAANCGIRVLVTPGVRNTRRGKKGVPVPDGTRHINGGHTASGLVTVVRDIYFEPAIGHTVVGTMDRIVGHTRLGRPALLETHRANFVGPAATQNDSLRKLAELFDQLRARLPETRFMSTEELAEAYRSKDPQVVERRATVRLHVFLRRLGAAARLRKMAWLSGLFVFVLPIYLLLGTRPAVRRRY